MIQAFFTTAVFAVMLVLFGASFALAADEAKSPEKQDKASLMGIVMGLGLCGYHLWLWWPA